MKKCILSFATTDRNFVAGIRRIENCLKRLTFDGDFLYWIVEHGKFPKGCPSHLDSPWGFKAWCFQQAKSQDYDCALWFDSSVIPVNVANIFRKILNNGSYFVRRAVQIQENKTVGQVCSEQALNAMGLSQDQAFLIPQISVQRIGLNFHNEKARQFLDMWLEKSLDGVSFKGYQGNSSLEKYHRIYYNINGFASLDRRVIGHRHDQTIASILVHKLQIPWEKESDLDAIVDKSYVHVM